ncbi:MULTISPECIES: MFS transporter small subunit [unclassified Nocardiopsis]
MGTRSAGSGRVAKAAALLLWAVVLLALGYGVVSTAVQAAALFTG